MTNLFHLKSKSKSSKTPAHPPVQVLHLRYIDRETNEIFNFGGYTLAYRATFEKSSSTLRVTYAYAECSEYDNFSRKTGVAIASHRLNNNADAWVEYFEHVLEGEIDVETAIYALDDAGTIDVQESVFNLRQAVVDHLLANVIAVIHGDDLYNHIVHGGKSTYLSKTLLGFGVEEAEEEDVLDVTRKHFQAILDSVETYKSSATAQAVTAAAVWKAMEEITKSAKAGLEVDYADSADTTEEE